MTPMHIGIVLRDERAALSKVIHLTIPTLFEPHGSPVGVSRGSRKNLWGTHWRSDPSRQSPLTRIVLVDRALGCYGLCTAVPALSKACSSTSSACGSPDPPRQRLTLRAMGNGPPRSLPTSFGIEKIPHRRGGLLYQVVGGRAASIHH